MYNAYAAGSQPGCISGNRCALVTGTRVTNYDLLDRGNGKMEQLTFEVIPNATYIPQTKLFNSQTGQSGAFQTIIDLRRWATETDARTNMSGFINVQYNNQYSQTQCKSFPVDIEDSWRMLESIDSVINWGDTSARPEECVSQKETTESLDIYSYWLERGNTKGAIPEPAYKNGLYLYLPKIPAVKIGPGPTAGLGSYYPTMQNYSNYQGQNGTQVGQETSASQAKNCGLLDRLSDIKYQKDFDGVIITVEATRKGGSILNNTLGPNLMVSINRNNIKSNCVVIETNVGAKLTRAANFQSGEVMWKLTALVTAEGYTMLSDNINDAKKECTVITDINAPAVAKGCASTPAKYGMNLIEKTSAKMLATEDYANYCTEKFCNNDMLQVFLRNKLRGIETATKNADIESICKNETIMLKDLYKAAQKVEIKLCDGTDYNYYKGDHDKLIEENYKAQKEIIAELNEKITAVKERTAEYAMSDMVDILETIESENNNELFLKINATSEEARALARDQNKAIKNLGIIETKKDSNLFYMPLSYLKELNEQIKDEPNCTQEDGDCIADICETPSVEIPLDVVKWIFENSIGVVKTVNTSSPTAEEIEKIYEGNTKFNRVHKLAMFESGIGNGKDLLLTQIDKDATLSKESEMIAGVPSGFGEDKYKLIYQNTIAPSSYAAQLDMNLCKVIESTKTSAVDVNLVLKATTIKDATEVKKNIILQSGFNITENNRSLADSTTGAIIRKVGNATELLARVPIKLELNLNPQETEVNYSPVAADVKATAGSSLINWTENGAKKADTKGVDGKYIYKTEQKLEAKQLSGIYYYPDGGDLRFYAGNGGGSYTATAVGLDTVSYSLTETLPLPRTTTDKPVQIEYQGYDLAKVIELINGGQACISTDGQVIQWNETNLLK